MTIRSLLLSLLLSPLIVVAQTSPCTQPGSLTTATSFTPYINNTSNPSCNTWALTWSSTGFTALTLQLEGSDDNVTYTAFSGSVVVNNTVNPSSALSGVITVQPIGKNAFLRVRATAVTGTGAINFQLRGSAGIESKVVPGGGAAGTCAALGGDVTGTCAANTVVKINGATVPANATVAGTNGAGQIIAAALANASIFIGSAGNLPVAHTLSGDCTITNTGAITCTSSGNLTSIFGNTGPAITNLVVPTGDNLTASGSGNIKATEVDDANQLPAIQVVAGGNPAVNFLLVTNAVAAAKPIVSLTATGASARVDLKLVGKGIGNLRLNNDSLVVNPSGVMSVGSGNSVVSSPGSTGIVEATNIIQIAGAAPISNGQIQYDTTVNELHAAQSSADAIIPQTTVTPTNGDCVNWIVSGGQRKLGTLGSACGAAGGGSSFSVISTGTNTTAAMVVSAGASLDVPTQAQNNNTTKAASTAYTDLAVANAVAGVNPAVAVQAATTGVLPNSPTYSNGVAGVGATLTAGSAAALVIDGYSVLLLDRVLVKNQASSFQNGVYFLSTLGTGVIPYILTRSLDFDQPSDMNNTGAIPVINGTVNGTTQWVITSKVTTVGTDAVTFAQFSSNPANQITTSTACGGDLNGTMPNCGVPKINGTAVTGTSGHCAQFGAGNTITDSGIACSGGGGGGSTVQAPLAFASIAACSTSVFQGKLNNALYDWYYCDGASALHYYLGGMELTQPSGFTWQNQSTATLISANGGELITSAVGASAANINGRFVSYPTAPFTRMLTAKIKGYVVNTHLAPNGSGGIYLSDGTKVIIFAVSGVGAVSAGVNGPVLIVQFGPTLTNITTNVSSTGQSMLPADLYYLQFRDGLDCTGATSTGNRFYCYSYDNVSFVQFFTEANTTNLTATRIGYFANAFDTGTFVKTWAVGWL